MKTLAIIGTGIAGLGAAHFLQRNYEITLFEADDHVGGHANTVEISEDGQRRQVDTGFMVFNQVTYPHLIRLFQQLSVAIKPTDMSFSVQHRGRGLEYCGSSLSLLFGQRRNLIKPSFYRLLMQINRFNSEAVDLLDTPAIEEMTLGEFVRHRGYGEDFLHLYLIPMGSAVWSTDTERMLQFPAGTLLRFFHNHGFLGLHTQHPWWTVEGGSQQYVEKLIAPFRKRIHLRTPVHRVRRFAGSVEVTTSTSTQRFDKAIFACHPPTALKILGNEATPLERRLLTAFSYQPNGATLHRDERVMPARRRVWSSWNQRIDPIASSTPSEPQAAYESSTHYWMNRLQGVSPRTNYFVSINGERLIDPGSIIKKIDYEHPLFDLPARKAQQEVPELNWQATSTTETYFVGAWQRYGFHEDGLGSAVNLSAQLLGRDHWLPQ
ncbi:MAG TPA: FAD-dependent oxidoreductase [Opitutaceae bacterium]|nr:FAD-dependent oxidoreductase [Opitutaceae bacterium]